MNDCELILSCQRIEILRSDQVALYLDAGNHLVLWQDNSEMGIWIDKSDVRALMTDLPDTWSSAGSDFFDVDKEYEDDPNILEEMLFERFQDLLDAPTEPIQFSPTNDVSDTCTDCVDSIATPAVGADWNHGGYHSERKEIWTREELNKPTYEVSTFVAWPDNIVFPRSKKQYDIILHTAKSIRERGAQLEILLKVKQADTNELFDFLNVESHLNAFYLFVKALPERSFWSLIMDKEIPEDVEPISSSSQDVLPSGVASAAAVTHGLVSATDALTFLLGYGDEEQDQDQDQDQDPEYHREDAIVDADDGVAKNVESQQLDSTSSSSSSSSSASSSSSTSDTVPFVVDSIISDVTDANNEVEADIDASDLNQDPDYVQTQCFQNNDEAVGCSSELVVEPLGDIESVPEQGDPPRDPVAISDDADRSAASASPCGLGADAMCDEVDPTPVAESDYEDHLDSDVDCDKFWGSFHVLKKCKLEMAKKLERLSKARLLLSLQSQSRPGVGAESGAIAVSESEVKDDGILVECCDLKSRENGSETASTMSLDGDGESSSSSSSESSQRERRIRREGRSRSKSRDSEDSVTKRKMRVDRPKRRSSSSSVSSDRRRVSRRRERERERDRDKKGTLSSGYKQDRLERSSSSERRSRSRGRSRKSSRERGADRGKDTGRQRSRDNSREDRRREKDTSKDRDKAGERRSTNERDYRTENTRDGDRDLDQERGRHKDRKSDRDTKREIEEESGRGEARGGDRKRDRERDRDRHIRSSRSRSASRRRSKERSHRHSHRRRSPSRGRSRSRSRSRNRRRSREERDSNEVRKSKKANALLRDIVSSVRSDQHQTTSVEFIKAYTASASSSSSSSSSVGLQDPSAAASGGFPSLVYEDVDLDHPQYLNFVRDMNLHFSIIRDQIKRESGTPQMHNLILTQLQKDHMKEF